MSLDEAVLLIRHYLSSLCWVERAGIRETGVTGGSGPFLLGRGLRGSVVTDHFQHDYLPDPSDSRVRLALALYREGMSAESVPHRLLSFFKVLNILFSSGKEQASWINANLNFLRDHSAVQRLGQLGTEVSDVGAYLYESGRCAVAHAYSEPLIDPENIEDNRRLARDLPLVRALAEHLIEAEFGLKSRHTIWREHLYQLEGFRELLGEDLIQRLKRRESIVPEELPALPVLNIGVRDEPALESFTGLLPTILDVESGVIWLRCDFPSGRLQMLLGLDVGEEYLHFDPEDHVALIPELTPEGLKARRDHILLLRGLLRNGQLEVTDADTGARLGRTDAYIGQNIDLGATLRNFDKQLTEIEGALKEGGGGDA
jgi:hypothetical protein